MCTDEVSFAANHSFTFIVLQSEWYSLSIYLDFGSLFSIFLVTTLIFFSESKGQVPGVSTATFLSSPKEIYSHKTSSIWLTEHLLGRLGCFNGLKALDVSLNTKFFFFICVPQNSGFLSLYPTCDSLIKFSLVLECYFTTWVN